MPSLRAPLAAGLALALVLVLFARGGPPAEAATINVTKTNDTADGACNSDCSLREAIIAANANPGADVVNVPAGTYTLTISGQNEDAAATGDLDIKSSFLTISGAGASSTIIDGGGVDRVFDVQQTLISISISGLTVRNGSAGSIASGGGIWIRNSSMVTLTNVVVDSNSAGTNGGGISNAGNLSVTGSTISRNLVTAPGAVGGGIHVATSTGNLTITNSTVSGNISSGSGGGISNYHTATLTNLTITGNQGFGGGGAYNNNGFSATTTVKNTIIAGNAANNGPDCNGNVSSQGYILVQNASGCTISGVSTGNLIGPNPFLGPLADNGGPTQTHEIFFGSPAINNGGAGCPSTDQRGAPRVGVCDIGSFEYGSSPGPAPTPTPSPTPTPVPTPTPSPTPTSPPPSGGTAGNVDCSGGGNPVDAVDGLKILRWVAGLQVSQNEPCTNPGDAMTSGGNPYIQGDVDCSGIVNAVDALKILRWLAGLPISLGECPPLETQV
ncbi:MAG TPA: choice-of-anchor Q domain-containing protein [Dehalococcoidia bacterium]|nr:choice-of-anchor Q domain-containing protein [Dehalococcoidia bacterium]